MTHARRTDPPTSERGVNQVLSDISLYEQIVAAAARSYDEGKKFTDSWLARQTRRPRNVVARVRLEVERDGWIVRDGETPDGTQLLFRMKENYRAMFEMVSKKDWLIPEEGR